MLHKITCGFLGKCGLKTLSNTTDQIFRWKWTWFEDIGQCVRWKEGMLGRASFTEGYEAPAARMLLGAASLLCAENFPHKEKHSRLTMALLARKNTKKTSNTPAHTLTYTHTWTHFHRKPKPWSPIQVQSRLYFLIQRTSDTFSSSFGSSVVPCARQYSHSISLGKNPTAVNTQTAMPPPSLLYDLSSLPENGCPSVLLVAYPCRHCQGGKPRCSFNLTV